MTEPFRSFVIFAEMRTGSNLLVPTPNPGRVAETDGPEN